MSVRDCKPSTNSVEGLVFLAIDGFSWNVATPLIEEGILPNLRSLLPDAMATSTLGLFGEEDLPATFWITVIQPRKQAIQLQLTLLVLPGEFLQNAVAIIQYSSRQPFHDIGKLVRFQGRKRMGPLDCSQQRLSGRLAHPSVRDVDRG